MVAVSLNYWRTSLAIFAGRIVQVNSGSLADIDHVILFMQGNPPRPIVLHPYTDYRSENRAFDHYFGTMAGVRGFSDPNVQVNPDGRTVWQQNVDTNVTGNPNAQLNMTGQTEWQLNETSNNNIEYLLPFYLNWEGGNRTESTQCMVAGDNGWSDNQAALNGGLNNQWATNNTAWSWGFFKRSDIPVQYDIADGWIIGDMYQESIIASTAPNRVAWMSGSINAPGSPQTPNQGGNPYIDNNFVPGCDDGGINCYPLLWKTVPEHYEDAGVSWSVFQDIDNFDDNALSYFGQFQKAANDSSLHLKGVAGESLSKFYARAANGTLPSVSIVVGPMELSEHAPMAPRDGAWLQKRILEAVTQGPSWSKSVLIYSYDETGGWGDHVVPYHSPPGTAGEWIDDPDRVLGQTYTGPGFRVPFYIVSPWTRTKTGAVFTEHADHNSQILFIEEWLAAQGKNVVTNQMVPWRRQHMSNLVNAFDFDHPDYSIPEISNAPAPTIDAQGAYYHGSFECLAKFTNARPRVPLDSQIDPKDVPRLSEEGFKVMRGALTEGRYIVFELGDWSLSNNGGRYIEATKPTSRHEDIAQRWIVHSLAEGGNKFKISSAKDGRYLGGIFGEFCGREEADAQEYTVIFHASQGYALQREDGKFLSISRWGSVVGSSVPVYFQAYSVTYHV
ncbi:phospholipase C [Exophiala aquamarina CBS 119918]|uniref:Phospholipase C n=1 Tax=Exophiala aquamarina CBS 119918 TaxID=1182545 RepID=A0A072P8C4_9EURO|nr:phospholipase C [Exophiala aquamarina CBS 119918]KEF56329.1 phospholipase C [Exophiala aquamarina CBS 119918]